MNTTRSRGHYSHNGSWLAVKSILWLAVPIAVLMMAGTDAAAQPIGVTCSLPYSNKAQSDQACVGHHTVTYNTTNTDGNAKVTAELLGLDVNGNLISSFIVPNGQEVQLGSRLPQGSWKFNHNPNLYEIFAPVPLLHVTVEDRGQKAEAFCSNIPYVHMIEPTGDVVTESSGNNTNVLAAVPLTDPRQLHLFVDGVDLLPQVPSPGYLACTPYAPCSGTATINGNTVTYSDLIVDVASDVGTPASNTVRVTLTDLSCGGHIFNVSSAKAPGYPAKVAGSCNVDSLSKKANSSVFEISITDPTPLKVTPIVPTPVAGQVCSGTQITSVNINGKSLPVTGETHTVGNGTTTGDVYQMAINTTLDQTDLVRSAFGDHQVPLGTFDAGSNRLAASATDILGNRTFENVIFATGSVAPVAVDPNAQVFKAEALKKAVHRELKKLVETRIKDAMDPPAPANTDLANAFVVGLSASGAQTMYSKLCTSPIQCMQNGVNVCSDPTVDGLTPGQVFSQKVKTAIQATPLPGHNGVPQLSVYSACSCNPPVNVDLKSVTVGGDVTCNLTFNNGSFHVTMGLPDVHVVADAVGFCEEDLAGVCTDGAAVGIEENDDITGIKLDFDVTEGNLLGNTTSTPAFFAGTSTSNTHDITNPFGDQGISTCGLSDVCVFIVQVFTFGAVDLTPSIDITKVQDFSGQVGATQPDPVKLHQIKVDPSVIANFDQKASGDISEVHITPSGITAGLVGHFASLAVDPSVPQTPGITLTPAPVPTLPVPNAKDVFIGVSDDAINMMFASLTAAGKLQTGTPGGNSCIDTGMTVGSILPAAGCDTLTADSDGSTVAARALCHAIKGDNCGSLSFNDPAQSAANNASFTATEQGVCYGAQGLPTGQTCSTLSQNLATGKLVFLAACGATPNYNVNAGQPLLFCAKGDVPPRMLFPDNAGNGSSVPAVLRIPSLSVELVVDRNQDHQVSGALADIAGCFAKGASTAVDCNIFSACFGLNLDFSMASQTCAQDGKPGFIPTFQDIQVLTSQIGTVCGGSSSPTSDPSVLQQGSNNQITIPLGQNGAGFAPPICGAGLDLGGFAKCSAPGVLSIRSENTFTDSRDYLAITCSAQ